MLTETVTVNNSDTTTQYIYNEQNHLLSATETSGGAERTTAFYYDNNCNQISKLVSTIAVPNGDAEYAFAQPGSVSGDDISFELDGYDTFGRLVSVRNDLSTAEYSYNADGLRTSKAVTTDGVTTTTRFLYEGGHITHEFDAAGNRTAYNVYGGESIISRTTAQGTDYYLYNGRGDVVQLATTWGAVSVDYDYDTVGNLLAGYLDDTNPFRYCGEYWDDESRTYYLRARYYSPQTGRLTGAMSSVHLALNT